MPKKSKKEPREESAEADHLGMGNITLGGIFKGLGSLIDTVRKMEEEGKSERKWEGTLKGFSPSGKDIRGVYGFRIQTGITGKGARIEPFGNIKATKKGPTVAEVREPMVDVFDEKDHVLVIAELPGAREEAIKVDIKEDLLILEAGDGQERTYRKEILLPQAVDAASKTVSYQNGILEIRLAKKK